MVRTIDLENDIVTSGHHQFLYDKSQVRQDIGTRLRMFMGEWFRDVDDGTGWFQFILGTPTSISASAEIKRRISQTVGVRLIMQYNADYDRASRKYSGAVEVLTDFSDGIISINVQSP
jgi:hypothetical protein